MPKKRLLYKIFADNQRKNSWANKARIRRFNLFLSHLEKLSYPVSILDVGGTQKFWESMNYSPPENVSIVLLNLKETKTTHTAFTSLIGDACNMPEFNDKQFDVVFSNSVIEHLCSWENQRQMASEIMRVGKNYFIQTPNYSFPIEPHFVFPFFHYFPCRIRVWLTSHFSLGHYPKANSLAKAKARVLELRLLTKREMKTLFPDANFFHERIFGLTKSIIAYQFISG